MNKKFIKTQRLAGYLMLNGFVLLKMDKDKKNKKYDIYIFKNETGIEDAIDKYKRTYKFNN